MGTTAAQKKLFFNLRKLKSRLNKLDSDSALNAAQVTHIATALDVSEQDVRSMDGRLAAGDYSLNTSVSHDGEESTEWQDTLTDTAPTPEIRLAENDEQAKRSVLLNHALATLNDRERAIFVQRRLSEESHTLEGLAETYGISRERVRQIETRAFEKVQQFIQAAA
jgi:RNA polymerase sigma-32 factor